MTTIVANKHQMAADSRTVTDETWFHSDKLYRVGKSIVGLAGDGPAMEKFLAWYRNRRKPKPEFKEGESFAALVLSEDGLFHTDNSLCFDRVHDDYFAIGTGAVAALVALDLGCDLIRADEAAAKRDSNSGGHVVLMELNG